VVVAAACHRRVLPRRLILINMTSMKIERKGDFPEFEERKEKTTREEGEAGEVRRLM
jgi:hypothetical protein